MRDDIRLGVRWSTKEKLLRCNCPLELAGFMAGLQDQGIATPELRIEAEKLMQRRGWSSGQKKPAP